MLHVCGVTNWLLSLTGYANNSFSHSDADFLATHPAVSRPIVAVHRLSFGSYSIPLSCLINHQYTYMLLTLVVQASTPSFMLEIRRCREVKVAGAGSGE